MTIPHRFPSSRHSSYVVREEDEGLTLRNSSGMFPNPTLLPSPPFCFSQTWVATLSGRGWGFWGRVLRHLRTPTECSRIPHCSHPHPSLWPEWPWQTFLSESSCPPESLCVPFPAATLFDNVDPTVYLLEAKSFTHLLLDPEPLKSSLWSHSALLTTSPVCANMPLMSLSNTAEQPALSQEGDWVLCGSYQEMFELRWASCARWFHQELWHTHTHTHRFIINFIYVCEYWVWHIQLA